MAARTQKIRHDEQTRAKIRAAQIINRFQDCINGKVELDAQQVSCGKALLAKVLPDLQAVSLDAAHTHDVADPLKTLLQEVSASGNRLVKSNDG